MHKEATDPAHLDKGYWMSRVSEVRQLFQNLFAKHEPLNEVLPGTRVYKTPMGLLQLSLQLQQSSEYWSDKVRELNSQLDQEKSKSASPAPR